MESSSNIEKLLAMILVRSMGDAPQAEKATELSRAGLSNKDIAVLLGASADVIKQQLYTQRKAKKKKPPTNKK